MTSEVLQVSDDLYFFFFYDFHIVDRAKKATFCIFLVNHERNQSCVCPQS